MCVEGVRDDALHIVVHGGHQDCTAPVSTTPVLEARAVDGGGGQAEERVSPLSATLHDSLDVVLAAHIVIVMQPRLHFPPSLPYPRKVTSERLPILRHR